VYTALITGTNRGIGLELATQYARAGWRVFATCRKPQTASALKVLQRQYPETLFIERLDVANHAQIERLGSRLKGEAIDLLINNAGWSERCADLADVRYKPWERALRVNTFATLKMAQVFLDHVAKSKKRTIVTISSEMGSINENTNGTRYAYRVSKAAVNMVVKTLSVDLLPRKIKVVSLHPGWVKTALGGPDALLTKTESVNGLRSVIEGLTLADSGRFLSYDGKEIPW
jgi:NAD(P)-dependent dehydrogenase (short-subunit alcohol dehydrogenase family)